MAYSSAASDPVSSIGYANSGNLYINKPNYALYVVGGLALLLVAFIFMGRKK
jgi:hypothetical protein